MMCLGMTTMYHSIRYPVDSTDLEYMASLMGNFPALLLDDFLSSIFCFLVSELLLV